MNPSSILTDEERQRIENDERKRIAEEEYRAEIRARLSGATPQETNERLNAAVGPTGRSASRRRVWAPLAVAAILVFGGILAVNLLRNGSTTAKATPLSKSVTSGTTPDAPEASPLPKPPEKLTTAEIANRATPFVVVVENFNGDGQKTGQGSGYLYSSDGIVITNYHVVRGASSIVVKTHSGSEYRTDALLGYDIAADVAALKLQSFQGGESQQSQSAGTAAQRLVDQLAESAGRTTTASQPDPTPQALTTDPLAQVEVGDRVVAIGAPLGLESTVSEGIVSAIRDYGATRVIQTTASISPGSSGGPLLNEYGKVVGVTTATTQSGQNLNFVIASKHIVRLVSQSRLVSLSEMLTETLVAEPIGETTISVPSRQATTLQFTVAQQQGALLQGSYTVSGGGGRDVGVWLVGPNNNLIVNSGRVSGFGQFRQKLSPGRYTIVFDNRFSMFSAKSISPDLKLTYYR